MIVPLNHILLLSGLLFALGMFCILARRNLIMMLLGIEIMLNAAAVAFVGASLHCQQMEGQAMVIFILAIAATSAGFSLTKTPTRVARPRAAAAISRAAARSR